MNDVRPLVERLWPRGKWGSDEWTLFARKVKGFNLDTEQVRAVLEEERANSEYLTPNMKSILARMRSISASPFSAPATEPPKSAPRSHPQICRDHFPNAGGVEAAVVAWHQDAVKRSIRLRGFVAECIRTSMVDDLLELGTKPDHAEYLVNFVFDGEDVRPAERATAAACREHWRAATLAKGGGR